MTTGGEVIAKYLGYFCLVASEIIIPGLLIFMLTMPRKKVFGSKFQNKFGALTSSLSSRSKYTLAFYLVFVLRRNWFVTNCFLLSNTTSLQIQMVMLCNLFVSLYVQKYRPFVGTFLNRIEVMNEVTISVVSLHTLFFTDWVPDKET